MGLYEFNRDDAFRFADSISQSKKTVRGNQLVFQYCPYCNGGTHKDKGTFYISLDTGQFQCKRSSCDAKGNMITLARDFGFSLSEDVDRYFNMNAYNNKFKTFRDKHIESKDVAVKYLQSRGISEEITRKYEISVMNDNDNILCFPFRDENGVLTFIKYRNIDYQKGVSKGSKEFCESNCKPILFGMNHCEGFEQLVITEGQIDSLSLAEAGIKNAVSVPTGMNGFTWIPHCWDWITQFKSIIIFGDCEKNRITLSDTLTARFPDVCKVVKIEDYKGYKDANEILTHVGKQALIDAVNNAEGQTSNYIKEMADVKFVDISKIPTISTGIDDLDFILSGGYKVGQLILQSGERGNGKSTWASQQVVEALKQGYNAFIYSGEMPDFFVKSWIDRQIIGKQFLTNSEIDKCEDWYRGRLFLFDNTVVADDDHSGLLKAIEQVIRAKDVKFILIDNLMTALECDSNDALYRQQSNFVGKLADIAKKYVVVIMLIAHPRKRVPGMTNFTSDDVSGSADITNRVDIVMSYDRVYDSKGNEVDPNERKMTVTKNRLTGKITSPNREIYLFYSDESKRIVGKDRNFQRDYFNNVTNDGFVELTDDEIQQMNIIF